MFVVTIPPLSKPKSHSPRVQTHLETEKKEKNWKKQATCVNIETWVDIGCYVTNVRTILLHLWILIHLRFQTDWSSQKKIICKAWVAEWNRKLSSMSYYQWLCRIFVSKSNLAGLAQCPSFTVFDSQYTYPLTNQEVSYLYVRIWGRKETEASSSRSLKYKTYIKLHIYTDLSFSLSDMVCHVHCCWFA